MLIFPQLHKYEIIMIVTISLHSLTDGVECTAEVTVKCERGTCGVVGTTATVERFVTI